MLSEREASPPAERATQTDPRTPDRATKEQVSQASDWHAQFHPDVVAYCRQFRRASYSMHVKFQIEYDRGLARRIKAEDSSPVLTRIVGRSGSVDVNAGFERDRRRMKQGAR